MKYGVKGEAWEDANGNRVELGSIDRMVLAVSIPTNDESFVRQFKSMEAARESLTEAGFTLKGSL